MAQEFHVLCCYSCQTFQVHQVKKSRKWNCKMCGEKQSIIKVFGKGSGVDCRRHVQKLNSLRGEHQETETEHVWLPCEQEGEAERLQDQCDEDLTCDNEQCAEDAGSRWSKYLDRTGEDAAGEVEEEEEEEAVYTDRNAHCTSRPGGNRNMRKRKRSWGFAPGSGEDALLDCSDADNSGAEDPWNRTRQRGHSEKRDSRPSSRVPPSVPHDALVTSRPPPAADASTPPGASGLRTEVAGSKWNRFLPARRPEEEEGEEESPRGDPRPGIARAGGDGTPGFPSAPSRGRSESRERASFTCAGRSPAGAIGRLTLSQGCYSVEVGAARADCGGGLEPERPAGPQTLPAGKPPPSFHSLFHTDEDFDDSF